MGERLLGGLRELAAEHELVGEVRGKGLLCAVELVQPGTREPLPAEGVNRVMAAAQERGVLVGKNVGTVARLECVITLSPPLVAGPAEVERIVAVLDEALGTVQA